MCLLIVTLGEHTSTYRMTTHKPVCCSRLLLMMMLFVMLLSVLSVMMMSRICILCRFDYAVAVAVSRCFGRHDSSCVTVAIDC